MGQTFHPSSSPLLTMRDSPLPGRGRVACVFGSPFASSYTRLATKTWSGRCDSNTRPPAPKSEGCRFWTSVIVRFELKIRLELPNLSAVGCRPSPWWSSNWSSNDSGLQCLRTEFAKPAEQVFGTQHCL